MKSTTKTTKSPGATRKINKTTKAASKSAKKKGRIVKASKTKKLVAGRKPAPSVASSDSVPVVPVTTTAGTSAWSVEQGRPKAFSKLGKNKKKAWRRSDVDDVEVFLDEQRQDERTGASQLIDVKDEDLFLVDTKVSVMSFHLA
jgi:hypothetical protein